MILIVSSAQDTHAQHVAKLLEQRGCETKLLSRADFGAACRFTLDPVGRCGAIRLEDGTAVASDRVHKMLAKAGLVKARVHNNPQKAQPKKKAQERAAAAAKAAETAAAS